MPDCVCCRLGCFLFTNSCVCWFVCACAFLFQLVPIQDVARFILEVRRDRAAAASEIIIIALIAVEVAIAVVHNYF